MVKPAFHGQLKERPFPEVLLEAYRWRLTGTLAVWPEQPKGHSGTQDRIALADGVPVGARFLEPVASLRDGMISVMSRTRAVFAFYDADLVGAGPEVVTGIVNVYDLVAESIRRHPRRDAIGRMLMELSRGVVRLREDADLDALHLSPEERQFVKLLGAAPGPLPGLLRFGASREFAERVLVFLCLVGAVEVDVPAAVHPTVSLRPPKLQTGILTEELFGPGVYLSSATQEGPRATAPRPRRTSGVTLRKSNSVPPRPAALPPNLATRWDRLVEATVGMEDLDHFALLGVTEMDGEDMVQAAFLERVLDASPDSLPAPLARLRPWAHRYVGRLVLARDTLLDPEARAAYLERYRVGLGAPRAEKAEEARRRALELYRDAEFAIAGARWEEAVERLREARALHHRDARVIAAEAWAHFNIQPSADRLEETVALLRQALAIDPSLQQAYFYLGAMYERLGRANEAKEAYRVLLKLNAQHEDARASLARLLSPAQSPRAEVVGLFGARRKR